ncbi:MAG: type II toxin-antitoxin system RelE/ParE family toxin [Paracraurococcus sp.]
MTQTPAWRVVVTRPAQEDLRGILRWTRDQFGQGQEAVYAGLIEAAIRSLRAGPAPLGSRVAHPHRIDLRKLPIGRTSPHLLIYRAVPEGRIEVLRVLHGAMDIARHLPAKGR